LIDLQKISEKPKIIGITTGFVVAFVYVALAYLEDTNIISKGNTLLYACILILSAFSAIPALLVYILPINSISAYILVVTYFLIVGYFFGYFLKSNSSAYKKWQRSLFFYLLGNLIMFAIEIHIYLKYYYMQP
jgi:hypothetical protein